MTLSERRLKFLNDLFRSGKSYTKKELEEKVSRHIAPFRNRQEINDSGLEISKRSIDYDIQKLRNEHKAPLKCVNRKYFYSNPKFSIERSEIDVDALENIRVAVAILKQIPGLDLHKDLMEIIEGLETQNLQETQERSYIQFDNRTGYEGNKHLLTVLEASKIGSVISFDYQPFKADKPYRIILHPYLLKEYNNRWFLIGMTESARKDKTYKITQYGLERIKGKIKNELIQYYYHSKFDPNQYFAHVIGVSRKTDAKVEKVILRFNVDRARYVETNPIHSTQRHNPTSSSKTHHAFSYDLIPNFEFETIILSFGDDVEVREPESLRESIKRKVGNNKDLYF